MRKRTFTTAAITSMSFIFLILKSLIGGIIYAIAVFFTNKKLKKWDEETTASKPQD